MGERDLEIFIFSNIIADNIYNAFLQNVTAINEAETNQGKLFNEVVQRLRNKAVILTHPKGMPKIPVKKYNHLKQMEQSSRNAANAE